MMSTIVDNIAVKISMGIDQTEALPVFNILADNPFQEFALPGARGPDDVHVDSSVTPVEMERTLKGIVSEEQRVQRLRSS